MIFFSDSANALASIEAEILIMKKIFAVWLCKEKKRKFFSEECVYVLAKTLYFKCTVMKFHSENKVLRKSKIFKSLQRDLKGCFFLKLHIIYKI